MSREVGTEYESRAVEYIEELGHIIVSRNFYSKFGEIDIITMQNNIYHFIEVKGSHKYNPIYAITPSKLKKIIKTVNYFLLKNAISSDYVLDAIIIQNSDIQYIENITL